jgi:hypothetical protein
MSGFVGDRQKVPTFFVTELLGWRGSVGMRSRICRFLSPSLYRADAQLQHRACWREPRTGGDRFIEEPKRIEAI